MDLLERYLDAVAAQLSKDTREDIIAELRDVLLSRFEEREATVGRPLTDDEREAILHAMGHPLVVAARYRKGPQSLIGPELFPFWLFAVKAGLLVLAVVHGITLLLRIFSGSLGSGAGVGVFEGVGQVLDSLMDSGLMLIGVATVVGAIMEHTGRRPGFMDKWRVKDLGPLGISDPGRWGAAMGAAPGSPAVSNTSSGWTATMGPWRWPGGDHLVSAIAGSVFVLWWIGALHFPGLMTVGVGGEDAVVTPAPIWATLFTPVLLYALGQIAVDLFSLAHPYATRTRGAARVVIAMVGLWLVGTIFEAGHWFTLSTAAESARIAGDWIMLDFDRLRTLGDGERDLVGVASTLSLVMTWGIVGVGLGLAGQMLSGLWRLATGRSQAT